MGVVVIEFWDLVLLIGCGITLVVYAGLAIVGKIADIVSRIRKKDGEENDRI